ncbi:MAG: ribonuclease III [Candidatus Margulisiibacteriota bacterium]
MSMEPLSPERLTELRELEKRVSVPFINQYLLNQAMTHSSYAHEKNLKDNERLEFLGDAVLKLVVTEYIYNKFPTHDEGELTKIRAAVISDETLAVIGQRLELGEALLLSQNEKKGGGQKRKSNLANAFEALIGAVYLDAGIGRSRDLILENLRGEIEIVSKAGYIRDYKSTLQEFVQKNKWTLPQYRVIKESGPEHKRVFFVEVKVNGKSLGVGRGNNKKEAEQQAATVAVKTLKGEEKKPGILSRFKKRLKADDKVAD